MKNKSRDCENRARICINGMTENEQIRGPVRYIFELVNNLPQQKYEIYFIAGEWQKDVYRGIENKAKVKYFSLNKSKISRALFFMFYMPYFLLVNRISVYHIPDTNPLPIFSFSTKLISTIHDSAEYVIPFRFSKYQAFARRIISRLQAKYSDLIITVSESSKKDIVKYLRVPQEKIEVVYNGVTHKKITNEDEVGNSKNVFSDGHYILYVGVLEQGKNVDKLVQAYAEVLDIISEDISLFLVGRKGNAYNMILSIVNEHPQLKDRVVIWDYVSEADLADLYNNALIFAYLSEYEGFGLPILEAMSYGIPVVTSNLSSLSEVAGTSAYTVSPLIPDIKKALLKLVLNEKERSRLSILGLQRAAHFSWKKCGVETENIYSKLLN